MLSPLKNLLTHFFMPDDGRSTFDEAHGLQLATAVLLVDVKLYTKEAAPQLSTRLG